MCVVDSAELAKYCTVCTPPSGAKPRIPGDEKAGDMQSDRTSQVGLLLT